MTALYKFLAGAVGLVLLGWVGYCGIQRAARNAVLDAIKVDSLKKDVKRTDSVFVADTIRLRTIVPRYETARRTLVITDTQRVRTVLNLADSTIRACTETVSSCATALKARDSLIKELQKPPYVPRLQYSATLAYDPMTGSAVLRGGPEFRLFWGIHAIAEVEASQPASISQTQGIKGALRVGVRKVF